MCLDHSSVPNEPNDAIHRKIKFDDVANDGYVSSRLTSPQVHPRKCLRIRIPSSASNDSPNVNIGNASPCSPSSLFSALLSAVSSSVSLSDDENDDIPATSTTILAHTPRPAMLAGLPIPGLFFNPALRVPQALADSVTDYCMNTYFQNPDVNQIMLFTRFSPSSSSASSLPLPLTDLLSTLSNLLEPLLPPHTHALLFPHPSEVSRARQAILNLYHPGEGITSHVDLLNRFGDGILGISFGSGCVMRFTKAEDESGNEHGYREGGRVVREVDDDRKGKEEHNSDQEKVAECWELYLPERSILVMSEDARYKWTHGIDRRTADFVELGDPASPGILPHQPGNNGIAPKGEWIQRGVRLSITFRWLLPGADIVGPDCNDV